MFAKILLALITNLLPKVGRLNIFLLVQQTSFKSVQCGCQAKQFLRSHVFIDGSLLRAKASPSVVTLKQLVVQK